MFLSFLQKNYLIKKKTHFPFIPFHYYPQALELDMETAKSYIITPEELQRSTSKYVAWTSISCVIH